MDTKQGATYGRRRRRHSAEFKAKVIGECRYPGMSIAAVALANGLNANLLRRWVAESSQEAVLAEVSAVTPGFVPVAVGVAPAPAAEILIEVQRGAARVQIRWPVQMAGDCAAWLRGWLR